MAQLSQANQTKFSSFRKRKKSQTSIAKEAISQEEYDVKDMFLQSTRPINKKSPNC
jgi:hypothetical protein